MSSPQKALASFQKVSLIGFQISGDRFVAPMESLLAQFANHRIPHHLGVVSLLLNAGADVDATSDAGETPLHFVAVFDRFQTAKMLITAGANLEIADVQKETPLHEAAAYAARGVVQVDEEQEISLLSDEHQSHHCQGTS